MADARINVAVNLQADSANFAKQIQNIAKGQTLNLKIKIPSLAAGNLKALDKRLTILQKKFDSTNAAAKKLGSTLSVLPNVAGRLATSSARVNKSLDATAKSLQKVGTQAKTATNELRDFGIQSGLAFRRFLAFTIPAGLVFGAFSAARKGVKDAILFEREMIRIGQVSGQTLKGLSSLQNQISSLATTFGTSSSELAGAARQLKQAGISVTDITKVLKTLAQTSLAPTFDDLQQTTEGAIAILAQFGDKLKTLGDGTRVKGVERLASDLGEINALSKAFAVESGDLIFAIRRTGGAFKAAGGNLQELLALFTSVRSTTRESAQTIATGFRTIFTRLQRPTTIAFLRELGVELTNLDKSGNRRFIGAFEAIGRIAKAIEDLPEGDVRISKIVERLGGFRQVSKVIPLLGQFEKAQRAIQVATRGQDSLDQDAKRGLKALGAQIDRTKEKFLELFRSIVANPAFQLFIRDVLKATNALIELAKQLGPIIPLIAGFAAIRGIFAVAPVARGFLSSFTSRASVFRNQGFNVGRTSLGSGGSVAGQGSRDTVPALLTPGEFVINKSSAANLGGSTLKKLNKFNKGGPVGFVDGGGVGRVPPGGLGGFQGGRFVSARVLGNLLRNELFKVLQSGDITRAPKGGLVTASGRIPGGQFLPREVTKELKKLRIEAAATALAFGSATRNVQIFSSRASSSFAPKTQGSLFGSPVSRTQGIFTAGTRGLPNTPFSFGGTGGGGTSLATLRSLSRTGLGPNAFPGGGVVNSGRGNRARRRSLQLFGRGKLSRGFAGGVGGASNFLNQPITGAGIGRFVAGAAPIAGIVGGAALANSFPKSRLASGAGLAAAGAGLGFLVGGPAGAVVGALGGLVVGIRNATKAINDSAVALRVNRINNLINAAGIKGNTTDIKRGLNVQISGLFREIEKQASIGGGGFFGTRAFNFIKDIPFALTGSKKSFSGQAQTLKAQSQARREVTKDVLSGADPNNILSFFNQALDAANSMEELTEALGPELLGNLTRFIQASKDAGLLSVSVNELTKIRFSKLRQLAKKEAELLDTTAKLIDVLTGISNLGFEVQDAFSSVANISNNVGAFSSFAGGGLGAANISSPFSGVFQRGFGKGSRKRLVAGVNAVGGQFNLGGEGDLILNIDKTVRTLGPLLDEFVKTADKTNLGTSSVSDVFLNATDVSRFFRQNKGFEIIEDALELAFEGIEVSSLKKTLIEAGGASQFLSTNLGVLNPVLETYADLLQRLIVTTNEWQNQLIASTQAQSRATQQIFDSQLSRLDAAQDLAKNLGEKFNVDKFTQLFEKQQAELTLGLGVGGGNDPRALGALITRLQADIATDRNALLFGDDSVKESLRNNVRDLNNANLALGRLADSSVLVAAAQEKLALAQDTNRFRTGISRQLAFGSADELRGVLKGGRAFLGFQQAFREGRGRPFLNSLSKSEKEQFENFSGRLPQEVQDKFNKQLADVFGIKLLQEPAKELFKIQSAAADAQKVAAKLLIEAANKQLEAANKQLSIPQQSIRNPGQPLGPGFAGGGLLPGNGNSDTVPALLTPGEFVINKRDTQRNAGLLEAINSGQRFHDGGRVRARSRAAVIEQFKNRNSGNRNQSSIDDFFANNANQPLSNKDANDMLKGRGLSLKERRDALRAGGRGLAGRRAAGKGAAINKRDKKLARRARNRARIRERTKERREGKFGRRSILDLGRVSPFKTSETRQLVIGTMERLRAEREAKKQANTDRFDEFQERNEARKEKTKKRQGVERRERARERGRKKARTPQEKLAEARARVEKFRTERAGRASRAEERINSLATPGGGKSLTETQSALQDAIRNRNTRSQRPPFRAFDDPPFNALPKRQTRRRPLRQPPPGRSFVPPRKSRSFIFPEGEDRPASRFIRAPGSRGRRAGRNVRSRSTIPGLSVPGIQIEGITPDEIDDFLLRPFRTNVGPPARKKRKLPRFRGDGRRRPGRRFQTGGVVNNNKDIADLDLSSGMAGAMKMFETGVKMLGEHMESFAKSVAGIPSQLQVTGTQNVQVTINGVEAFEKMMPAITELINDVVSSQLSQSLGPATEGSSRLDAAGVGRGKKGGLRR